MMSVWIPLMMKMSKFDFITHLINYYKSKNIDINSLFEQELFIDVYTMCRNRQDVILNNVKFKRPKRTIYHKPENNYSTTFLSAVNTTIIQQKRILTKPF